MDLLTTLVLLLALMYSVLPVIITMLPLTAGRTAMRPGGCVAGLL